MPPRTTVPSAAPVTKPAAPLIVARAVAPKMAPRVPQATVAEPLPTIAKPPLIQPKSVPVAQPPKAPLVLQDAPKPIPRATTGPVVVLPPKPSSASIVVADVKTTRAPVAVAAPLASPVAAPAPVVVIADLHSARYHELKNAVIAQVPAKTPVALAPGVVSPAPAPVIPVAPIVAPPIDRHAVTATRAVAQPPVRTGKKSSLLVASDLDELSAQMAAATIAGWTLSTLTTGTAAAPLLQVVARKPGEKPILSAVTPVGDSRMVTWRLLAAAVLRHAQ